MFPDARLDLTLHLRDGVVADVSVRSTRLVQASRLFSGRRPDEVTHLLPTLFALCGTAQVLAGLAAMEQASGLPPSPAQAPARQLLLLAETVSEHGLALTRDWPAQVGAEIDMPAARRLRIAMTGIRPALYPANDWTRPGGGIVAPARQSLTDAIATARDTLTMLLGAPIDDITGDFDRFTAWMAQAATPAARLLAQVWQDGLAGFGRGPFLPMPEQGPADLSARLAADRDGTYVAHPDSAGRVFETGPLARQAWNPVVAALIGAHGPGLLARLAARLVEVASSLQEMDELVQTLGDTPAPAACLVAGGGLGLVEAARGLLAHRVELEGGRVKRYQILAPTEWNFHPDGPLARGLRGTPATPDLQRHAALLTSALDPCVACSIMVESDTVGAGTVGAGHA